MYFPSPSVRITNALSGIGVGVEAFGKGFPVESVVPMVPISYYHFQNCIPRFLSVPLSFLCCLRPAKAPFTALTDRQQH